MDFIRRTFRDFAGVVVVQSVKFVSYWHYLIRHWKHVDSHEFFSVVNVAFIPSGVASAIGLSQLLT